MDNSNPSRGKSKAVLPRKRPSLNAENINADLAAAKSIIDMISEEGSSKILDLIRSNPESIYSIIDNISLNKTLEKRRKFLCTSNIMKNGTVDADFEYVGLPQDLQNSSLKKAYDTHLRSLLEKRSDGFAVLFEHLDGHQRPYIVETGCLRVPNNWAGDGQSTFLFDWYARERQGSVFSIDINPASIDSARRACSGTTNTILNDSRPALNALAQNSGRPASLLYLDSFDLDINDPLPSAIHHATEMMAARALIQEGTIICVDDFNVPPLGAGGKGLIVDQFMVSIGAKLLYSGYQKIWKL
ncbi:hypothetical protein D5366_05555 [Neokomagataea tanensis]|uniref:Uncharacterized protein n=2 Tax=Neokomagataea TaxID=1223423 RepID=A0A4Y6VBD9_9PROT|nr:hypothetical protein D5366_05555 [Neokomagataea tanensis]